MCVLFRFAADLLLRSGLLCRFNPAAAAAAAGAAAAAAATEDVGLTICGFIAELLFENGSGAVLLLFLLLAGKETEKKN